VSGAGDPPDDWRRGVRPLAPGKERPPAPPGDRKPPRPAAPDVVFEIRRDGRRVEGFAPGVDAALLRRLRRGEPAIESRLDLHGCDRAAARRAVREHLQASAAAGRRAVLVIHGRGRGSPEAPVLKTLLPDWLTEPPLDRWVLAFTSAPPAEGGAGALRVLLRRRPI
jgi:DNA-nicking Smr family endonuclease